ncbi:leucine-rich repeat-containing serine/threonine-protein kinase [Pseudomonas syringae]|nr:leucine-rich repeat-containing serine/threonine-protein kinase [Pseudomonas syringae]MCQ3033197.1 leucine-rich repeat-containing serine/threonine-protein kinase [Pseudomonas syringae]MDG6400354.1 leucine-rich repeat-containing protein kinase family protein [Pseudomonas quasicaspiana]
MHTLEDLRAGKLAGIKRLDLSCGLNEFPVEIFDLADSLEILNLSGNNLSVLPDDLYRLSHLKVLFCSDNPFTELPACIGRCQNLQIVGFKANQISHVPAAALPPRLRWLILTDNQIEQLPERLGECRSLQKLMLAGNRLTRLPASLARCEQLELLRIAANQLPELPDWLLQLPSLAWLAFAGNPLCSAPDVKPVRQIPWTELSIQQQLGEGASGVIQQALWQPPRQAATTVAVKLYKGAVTSDGSPLNEMAACIAAGTHQNLIAVEGQILGHPQSCSGLVMQLIEPSFVNLAGPPSLDSCSRDIYPNGFHPSRAIALRMARGIASATAHLHQNGMTHGDLYGHNILWHDDGDCLLGDFGAASFYSTSAQGVALQRIETRAFGILLGELLERCAEPVEDALWALQARCIQPNVSQRPTLREVEQALTKGP